MNTLTTSPCSVVVARLFAEADASDARLEERRRALPASGLAASMTSTENYRALYGSLKDFHLAVSREAATLLYMLARSTRARAIVEFGTSFGVSTLHLAAALRDNGGGRLIGTEFESTKVEAARATIAAAGLDDLVEIRAGDAVETLARDLPETVDLVLLDGAKGLYSIVLSLLEPRLRAGALNTVLASVTLPAAICRFPSQVTLSSA
jgi:predicted O-methyltransferase YrrM